MPQPLHDTLSDPGAESGLLAALQDTPALAWRLAGQLTGGHFTDPQRAEAFTRLMTDALAEHQPPRLVDDAPAADPDAAARRIVELATGRTLEHHIPRIGQLITRLMHGEASAADVLAAFEVAAGAGRAVHGAATSALAPAAEELAAVLADVQARVEHRRLTGSSVIGIPTGFRTLDDRLNGLEPGLIVLAGKPGAGKTTLANLIGARVAEGGTPVLYISYENSRANLILKHLCRLAGVKEVDARRGMANPAELATAAAGFVAAQLLYYVEADTGTTTETIRGLALQVTRRHGAGRCLIVVDYLQKLAHSAGYDELRGNVSAITARLRDLARALDSPVLALASLNRGGYATDGSKPGLANLKESGDLEYGADAVLLLSEDQSGGPPMGDGRVLTLTIAKNRGGEAGTTIPLVYKPSTGDFRESTPIVGLSSNGATR